MIPLAVFGNFAIDDLVFADGTTRWSEPGGSAVYAALGAAVWAEQVAVVAPIGADYPRSVLIDLDCTHCRGVAHTMRNWGLYEEDGTRHFVSRNRDRDWQSFCPEISDIPAGIQAAHLGPMPVGRALELTKVLRGNGTSLISADIDDHDLLGGDNLLLDLLRAVNLFLPSEQDIQRLWPGVSVESALRRLRNASPFTELIAVKRGADGLIFNLSGEKNFFALPSVAQKIVDVTGAGDAFCGGVLAGYSQGATPADALVKGSLSAAWCLTRQGVDGLLTVTKQERDTRFQQERRRAKAIFN